MRFHHMAIVAASLLGSPALSWTPSLAADNTTTLRTALSHMPEGILATSDPMPIAYLDIKAMSKAENGALSEGALRRLSLGRLIRPMDSLAYNRGKAWTEKAGVAFEDMSYFVGTGMPPSRLTYWGLADEKAAAALFDGLTSRNFRQVQANPRMLANGEPRAISLATRDPENPWLGDIGQSSFVIVSKEALVQGQAPEDLKPAIDMVRSVADNPAIATALDGLAKAPASKDASIVQALVITPLFGLAAVDASDLLLDDPADMDAMKKKIEAKVAENARGIPPYLAGIMVDAQQPAGPALVISLAYTDCAAADIAVATIQTRWNKTMDISRLVGITGQAVPADNGACAAVLSFAAKAGVNEPLFDAYNRYLNRDFNFLQIGKPE